MAALTFSRPSRRSPFNQSTKSRHGLGPSSKQLASLCNRLALALESGIDVRRVWQGEAERARGKSLRIYQAIAKRISQGDSLADAMATAPAYFPRLFVEMAAVGEQTGSAPEVFRRLANHYEHQVRIRRALLTQIAWPLLQLLMAVVVVGILIAIGGVLTDGKGNNIDVLGLGLTGSWGLMIYANALIGIFLLFGGFWAAMRRYPELKKTLVQWIAPVPIIGDCFEKIALGRIAWALHLTLNTEMDLRRLAPLVLSVSDDGRFGRHANAVAADLHEGRPLSVAFARTGLFPKNFLDTLIVAEESGQIVESMERLSHQYEEEAEHALSTLAVLAGFAVWGLVATLIILLIFRVFGFYTDAIYDALEGI